MTISLWCFCSLLWSASFAVYVCQSSGVEYPRHKGRHDFERSVIAEHSARPHDWKGATASISWTEVVRPLTSSVSQTHFGFLTEAHSIVLVYCLRFACVNGQEVLDQTLEIVPKIQSSDFSIALLLIIFLSATQVNTRIPFAAPHDVWLTCFGLLTESQASFVLSFLCLQLLFCLFERKKSSSKVLTLIIESSESPIFSFLFCCSVCVGTT